MCMERKVMTWPHRSRSHFQKTVLTLTMFLTRDQVYRFEMFDSSNPQNPRQKKIIKGLNSYRKQYRRVCLTYLTKMKILSTNSQRNQWRKWGQSRLSSRAPTDWAKSWGLKFLNTILPKLRWTVLISKCQSPDSATPKRIKKVILLLPAANYLDD